MREGGARHSRYTRRERFRNSENSSIKIGLKVIGSTITTMFIKLLLNKEKECLKILITKTIFAIIVDKTRKVIVGGAKVANSIYVIIVC